MVSNKNAVNVKKSSLFIVQGDKAVEKMNNKVIM